MKIAYTINGLLGGFSGKNSDTKTGTTKEDYVLILRYISNILKKNIAEHNDVDFFIFSWHTDLKDEFLEYLPSTTRVISLLPQLEFPIPLHLRHGDIGRVIAHKSRWYGFKQVMSLVDDYEVENNFEYDLVVNARFDLCWTRPYDFSKLDNNRFHIPAHKNKRHIDWGWPNPAPEHPEIVDHVFASNSNWMKGFSSMFDHLDIYTLPGQCPTWNTISHHFLMVWHLRQLGILSEEWVIKSFGVLHEECEEIIGGTDIPNVDYDIFRYLQFGADDIKNKI